MLKSVIQKAVNKLGYKILKVNTVNHEDELSEFTMQKALSRCIQRGLNINTVIDVGASDGRWSRMCMYYFPNAYYFLIEANPAHVKNLENFICENKNSEYILAAAANKEGTLYFDNSDIFGGLASEIPFADNCIIVNSCTLDKEIEKRKLLPPFLIKMDTHGFEKEIIEGALNIINLSNLIIVETYNYQLTSNSLKYFQLCKYMEELGFSSIELVDFMLRDYDNTFWQMDTFYIPSSSKEFKYNCYK